MLHPGTVKGMTVNYNGYIISVTQRLQGVYHVGLCRTCEIFGVSQVVLNSTNIIEDSQFQALSVSAEKWVPIIQVYMCGLFF